MSGRIRFTRLLALALLAGLSAPALAGPVADLHRLEWFVHVDLIDAGAGRDLAFWQATIDQAMADGSVLLEGGQGPIDAPCCTRLERSVAVSTFGSTGDGLDVMDSAADQAAITATGLPGSQAILIDSLTHCGGAAPTAIGCGLNPGCDGDPDDDPDLWLVVTVDALDSNILGKVLAHERGHNSCLTHVDTDECLLMRSGGGGGCIDATECSNLRAARNATGGDCSCHDGAGDIEPDFSLCTEVTDGVCSGGLCGAPTSSAGVELISAGGPESSAGEDTDDALRMSALSGDWKDTGPFDTPDLEVKGLAFATDSSTLYGVVPTAADDSVVVIDRLTGAITSTIGTIANGSDELVALAYDPGASASASDDRLLALETDGTFDELYEIDPASASSPTFVGALAFGAADGFRGLAYDSAAGKLYTLSPFADGLYEIDTSTCPFFCGLVQQVGLDVSRFDASLAWSSETGLLYLVGTQNGVSPLGPRTLYNTVDPATGTKSEQMGLDDFTPAGLAAMPVPPVCSDGLDNDDDGFVDFPADPGCRTATSVREDPQCQNGGDDDNDGRIDFDGGQSIHGACGGGSCPPGVSDPNLDGVADPDSQCAAGAWKNREKKKGCGLGFEIAAALVPLAVLRRRRALGRRG